MKVFVWDYEWCVPYEASGVATFVIVAKTKDRASELLTMYLEVMKKKYPSEDYSDMLKEQRTLVEIPLEKELIKEGGEEKRDQFVIE